MFRSVLSIHHYVTVATLWQRKRLSGQCTLKHLNRTREVYNLIAVFDEIRWSNDKFFGTKPNSTLFEPNSNLDLQLRKSFIFGKKVETRFILARNPFFSKVSYRFCYSKYYCNKHAVQRLRHVGVNMANIVIVCYLASCILVLK